MRKIQTLALVVTAMATILMVVHLVVPHHHHGIEIEVLAEEHFVAESHTNTVETDCCDKTHHRCSGGGSNCISFRQAKKKLSPAPSVRQLFLRVAPMILAAGWDLPPASDSRHGRFLDRTITMRYREGIRSPYTFRAPPVF